MRHISACHKLISIIEKRLSVLGFFYFLKALVSKSENENIRSELRA